MSKKLTRDDLVKLRDHGPNSYTQAEFYALLDFAIGHFHEDEQPKPAVKKAAR
jgi:hypothetical protein